MLVVNGTEGDGMQRLRGELDRRQARRFRRRWRLRRQRRQLLVALIVAEREFVEAPTETLQKLHRGEVDRIEARLERNARRLFR
ncbi:MAG TPA: hypothetical protein VNB64_02320 [Solirubrobacteraceae bacterium]|nr:hypothetical protein [Solirubrobacteraceae bacterium]